MQFCQPHWDKLRAEVEKQGMMSLVSTSGEECVTRINRQKEEGITIDTFEPLAGAHMGIVINALPLTGTLPGCPMCYLNEQHNANCVSPEECGPDPFEWWIEKSVEEQKRVWEALKA